MTLPGFIAETASLVMSKGEGLASVARPSASYRIMTY